MRYNFNISATIKRLGAYSSDKATYASVAGTIRGSFQPIEPGYKTEQLQIVGQAYEFITDGRTQDVRVNDVLTIDAIEYRVKATSRYRFAGLDLLKCVAEDIITA